MRRERRIVVLGMISKIPVAGVVWQTAHYLLGLQRLGFTPYYVESHASTPSMLMQSADDDSVALATGFIDRVMRRFDLGDRWAYQALHTDGACHGMSARRLAELYDSADLIINLHGGTAPREEHSRTGRLVYVETDPVELQVELQEGRTSTLEFLEHHCAFFTFGENWGAVDCGLPATERFDFRPTRQPVCLDLWPERRDTPAPRFTTVGNWHQQWRDVTLNGRVYRWSKHLEFEKVLGLPALSGRRFELALSNCDDSEQRRLRDHGWQCRDAAQLSADADAYRSYVSGSFAEFTVAKEQNVALRSGWFSDRSATYLAAGRPVITQETGFSNHLPTGKGLHGFTTLDEAVGAVEAVCADYPSARRSARELAREYFASDVVLGELLAAVGISSRNRSAAPATLTPDLRIQPRSRRPLRLSAATEHQVRRAPLPFADPPTAPVDASVVVVTYGNLCLTRMCLESVLHNTGCPGFELTVVDNGSRDGTRSYLKTLARRAPALRLLLNDENRGFPAAVNQGLAAAGGDVLVILNNDTIVPPGWLDRLCAHLADPGAGLVGPVTNRIGNEAEVPTAYETYGEFLREAHQRATAHAGAGFEIPMPAMFCLAMTRRVYQRLGPLDEQFGLGTLEDDDYAERARAAGYRSVCAEDVLVHHFGEGSFGRLFVDGAYSQLLEDNRRRFELKWGKSWQPYARRDSPEYRSVRDRILSLVHTQLDDRGPVAVVSHGDDELVRFADREGWHFPQTSEGIYAGHHPVDGAAAIDALERLRSRGAGYFVLPRPSFWWLEHYAGLGLHLARHYSEVVDDDACRIFALRGTG